MKNNFCCPVCSNRKWKTTFTKTYSNQDKQLSEKRYRILFKLWFPKTSKIMIKTICCTSCGFVCYKPRPEEKDIDAKYKFLQKVEKDIGGHSDGKTIEGDRIRARDIYKIVNKYVSKKKLKILDFGGGNGKLMLPFMQAGHYCYLVDYNICPLPGINKIGNNIEEITPNSKFDVIICSHVLEHVAEPKKIIRKLSKHLSNKGVIYSEVPMEVTKGVGWQLKKEPITHINFFTLGSFRKLFLKLGLKVYGAVQRKGRYSFYNINVLSLIAKPKNVEDKELKFEI